MKKLQIEDNFRVNSNLDNNEQNFNEKYELVLIAPYSFNIIDNKKTSIFQVFKQDLKGLLKKSLMISSNIMIILPKFIDIQELSTLFSEQIEELKL